jgi:excinuclease ABC subunit A
MKDHSVSEFVQVRGAREHNLKNVDVDIPRNSVVVHVRRLFAATPAAKSRRYDAGRFSINMPKGRCETCEGEGFVSVELLFMPSVYAPCPTCHGDRYNEETLKVTYNGKNIAAILGMTVREAREFFANDPPVLRSLQLLQDIGLGYLRLGQPATELSGGEAQRIKLATELQRAQRGDTLHALHIGRADNWTACRRR